MSSRAARASRSHRRGRAVGAVDSAVRTSCSASATAAGSSSNFRSRSSSNSSAAALAAISSGHASTKAGCRRRIGLARASRYAWSPTSRAEAGSAAPGGRSPSLYHGLGWVVGITITSPGRMSAGSGVMSSSILVSAPRHRTTRGSGGDVESIHEARVTEHAKDGAPELPAKRVRFGRLERGKSNLRLRRRRSPESSTSFRSIIGGQ